jgi:hypothetical protein
MQDESRRAIIWIAIVATVTVILLIAVLIVPMDSGRWDGMRNRAATLKHEARSRNVSRPVLRGEAVSGNAWDEYNLAINQSLALKQDQNVTNLLQFNARDASADRAMVERLIAAHPGVIDHLRHGARRANGQYPYEWDRGIYATFPSILGFRTATRLAIAQARILEDNGRPQDAADLLIDVSQFASDFATNGVLLSSLVGLSAYSDTLDGLRNLILSGKLSRQELATLAKELEVADRNFPTLGPAFTNEAANIPEFEPSIKDRLLIAQEGGWRYGLSTRQVTLDAFELADSHAQRSLNIDKLPFDAARKEAQAITAEAKSSANPLVRQSEPDRSKTLETHRDVHTRLRLLRAATIFLYNGDMPELGDPFGNNLSYAKEGGKLRIWSNGPDGESQNGQGDWGRSAAPDIVLEIGR